MLTAHWAQVEAGFFRGLNTFAEPLIRAGLGNPLFWPTGTLVIETTGRKSGRKFNVPVLATRFGELFVCATVRRNSHWLKNLAAHPEIRYWLGGRPHAATAHVIAPQRSMTGELPARVACLAPWLQAQSQLFGVSFAILCPHD
jgi:deazaflavin-dependent oxidoreductase (nitroreductase family)